MDQTSLNDKVKLLSATSLFNGLDVPSLHLIGRFSRFYRYKEKSLIFDEGNQSLQLFIVKEGEVVIRKQSNGEERDVAVFLPGESFGELDLLDKTPRRERALAGKDSTILAFPRRGLRFEEILQMEPNTSARVVHDFLAFVAGRMRKANKLLAERTPWIEGLKKQIYSDKLTGLKNRTYFEEELSSEIIRSYHSCTLAIVKPDQFKTVNDTFGHEAGDQVLHKMAQAAAGSLSPKEEAVRYRGDELLIIIPSKTVSDAGKTVKDLKRSLESIDLEELLGKTGFNLTYSIGVSRYPEEGGDSRKLAELAMKRMLDARGSGGNRIYAGE